MNKKLMILVSALLTILITLTIFIFVKQQQIEREQALYEQRALSHTLSDRNVGILQSLHDYDSNHLIAAYYPTFDMEDIDKDIKSYIDFRIDQYIADHEGHFVQTRPVLNIDYNSYQINDRFVSLYFEERVYSEVYANVSIVPKAMLLDLQEQKVVDVKTFFKGDYLNKLSELSLAHYTENQENLFKEGLEPIEKNFRNIVFKKDVIVVVFEKYQVLPGYAGQQEIVIPYEELSDYLVYDTQGKEIVVAPESEPVVEPEPEPEPIVEPVAEPEPEPVQPQEQKYIAFTFDDGPYPEVTNRITAALESVNGHGTFFVVGNRVGQYQDTLKTMHQNGHQIGNHSFNHPNLAQLDVTTLAQQINSTNQAIESIISEPVKLVRPTFGDVSDSLIANAGYPLINWSIDSLDWKSRDAQSVYDTVMSSLEPNAIVLFHDLYPSTAQAIEMLVPKLTEMGYKFVSVSQLAEVNGITLNPNQVYWKIK